MSALREELHELVDRLSDEQVLDALGELRTRVDRTDDQQPPRPPLSFTAVMRSGEGDLAERVEDVLRERFNRST